MIHRFPAASRSAFLLAGGLLAACTTTGNMPPLPRPQAGVAAVPIRIPAYRVQIGDVLALRFLLNPELNEEVQVRPDGMISTTVAGDTQAAGRTVPAIATDLRAQYGRELVNPRLNVEVKSFMPTRVYVAGEVSVPGEYTTVGPNLTLSQVIARAGGVKVSGSTENVFVIRRDENDAPAVYAAQYQAIISGRDAAADVRLAPYDVVYVPRTGVAEAYLIWNQYLQQFVPVSWGFSYLVGGSGGTVIPSGATTISPVTTGPTR